MVKPTNLKDWDFVKTKVHDISGLKDNSPSSYYYQLNNGIYYPAVRVVDMDGIPEPKQKRI
jgi:hypothetical protein